MRVEGALFGSLKCGDVLAFDGRSNVCSGNQGVALSVLNTVQRKLSAKLRLVRTMEAESALPAFVPVAA